MIVGAGLAGCGGDVKFGDTLQPGTGPGTGPSAPPANINIVLSSATLASSASDAANGVTITAIVTDANNNTVSNATVAFAASSGALQVTQGTTDDAGIATATLTTAGDPTLRAITVTAASGSVTRTATVQVVTSTVSGPSIASLALLPPSGTLPSDADTIAKGLVLTAIAKDANNTGVPGVTVTFSASSGLLQAITGTTDSNGFATATLTTGGDPTLRTITVTVNGGGQSATHTYNVVNPSTGFGVAHLVLTSSSPTLLTTASSAADGVLITAFATDSNGNAVAGAPISFVSSSGQLVNVSTTTDSQGRATATLTTGGDPTPRSITVTASIGSLTATLVPAITVSGTTGVAAVHVISSTNILSPDAATASQGATITAIVVDANGVALSNIPVTFATDTGALLQAQPQTDANGIATAILTTGGDTTPRTATVTATAGGQSGHVSVQIARASTLDLSVAPASLPSNADTAAEGSTVTATVLDEQANPLENVQVTFTASGGDIQPSSGTTNASGQTTAILTTGGDSTPRIITVTATATVGNVTLTRNVTVPVVAPVSAVTLLASAPQLSSAASTPAQGVTLTAIVTDSSGNLVSGVPVSFSAPGGGLQVTQGTTDSSGTATAVLTTGGNPANRTIDVTATAGGHTSNPAVSITVVGTALQIAGPLSVGQGSSPVTYTVTLTNSANQGISGRTVVVTSSLGNPIAVSGQTNFNGQTTFTYTPTNGGSDTVTALVSALNASSTLSVTVAPAVLTFTSPAADTQVNFGVPQTITVHYTLNGSPAIGAQIDFTTTRGDFDTGTPGLQKTTSAVTNGSGDATVTIQSDGTDGAGAALISAHVHTGGPTETLEIIFVAINPTSITLQASPSTIPVSGSSTLTAVVRDASNNLVANQVVDFALSDPTGGSLSATSGTTNSQGVVSVIYSAGTISSATNGVVVTATVDGTAVSATTQLTVGGQALFISLGTGNSFDNDPTPTTYALPYTAVVTDAAGNPAPSGTVFRLSVVSVAYQKGAFITCGGTGWQPTYTIPAPSLRTSFGQGCPSEDVNTNGILDPGEDANGNNVLDPGNVVTVPSTVDLNNGIAQFDLEYAKDRAFWVEITLKATASVAGSESVATTTFILPGKAKDYSDCTVAPPGQISPYGTGSSCASTANAQCSDGIDNDGDGLIDLDDPDCSSVLDDTE